MLRTVGLMWFLVCALISTGSVSYAEGGIEAKKAVSLGSDEDKKSPDMGLCKKYQNQYVAYYSEVFHIEDCSRRLLTQYELEQALRRKVHVKDIDGDVIQSIPLRQTESQAPTFVRSCDVFNKRFVTAHFVHVYYVEDCQKRVFPDWDSWSDFQKQHKELSAVILQLSDDELAQMADGPTYASVFDSIRMVFDEEAPDILPLDEACQGIDGEVVSYYQSIYRIENCRKRQISAQYLLAHRLKESPVELSAQQWMSLPDGEAIANLPESLEHDEP